MNFSISITLIALLLMTLTTQILAAECFRYPFQCGVKAGCKDKNNRPEHLTEPTGVPAKYPKEEPKIKKYNHISDEEFEEMRKFVPGVTRESPQEEVVRAFRLALTNYANIVAHKSPLIPDLYQPDNVTKTAVPRDSEAKACVHRRQLVVPEIHPEDWPYSEEDIFVPGPGHVVGPLGDEDYLIESGDGEGDCGKGDGNCLVVNVTVSSPPQHSPL